LRVFGIKFTFKFARQNHNPIHKAEQVEDGALGVVALEKGSTHSLGRLGSVSKRSMGG
jgi:hypothetical protein